MASIDELIKRDTQLTRSFAAALAANLALIVWFYFLAPVGVDGLPQLTAIDFLLWLIQFACYVWYAISAGLAARELGSRSWVFVVWILAAPILARLPIPIVSMLIGVSPLSIKFLLSGQLQSAMRQETSVRLHGA